MPDDTRDIAVEARADLRTIKEMLREHIEETREHRDKQNERLSSLENIVLQAKGAKLAFTGIIATATTIGLGTLAKMFGFIR
jgi:hypothetical protein